MEGSGTSDGLQLFKDKVRKAIGKPWETEQEMRRPRGFVFPLPPLPALYLLPSRPSTRWQVVQISAHACMPDYMGWFFEFRKYDCCTPVYRNMFTSFVPFVNLNRSFNPLVKQVEIKSMYIIGKAKVFLNVASRLPAIITILILTTNIY